MVEIKGFRREDAKEKADTINKYWVPGVNALGTYGRWDFEELTDLYTMEQDFAENLEEAFGDVVDRVVVRSRAA